MADEKNNVGMENQENEEVQIESAGCFGLGFSFLFPLIGIILYFIKKSKKFDARGYLYAACAGVLISFIINLVIGAMR